MQHHDKNFSSQLDMDFMHPNQLGSQVPHLHVRVSSTDLNGWARWGGWLGHSISYWKPQVPIS